ncbi:MAG: MoxR family ATPase [Lentisphaeria bacterium]|nr:MoxR family ATPase [Lentisphaeria bacterium]NQZ69301.1 MoxR family ATPase [Lentisphaeria bacterium]
MDKDKDKLLEVLERTRAEIAKVIIGQEAVIDQCLIAVFTGQHVLIEGVPGVAKTLLVRTLAHVLGVEFNRIQFTPDLMPADITGTNIYNMKQNEFQLVKGPVFTTFLLADEINRAPAKTQSALLQAMQERKVSIDRDTHELSPSFSVFATQNPVEYEGTYPLPEAQKDRFMLKVNMPLPTKEEELELVNRMLKGESPEDVLNNGGLKAVIDEADIKLYRDVLNSLTIREELISYILEIVHATRNYNSVLVGAGPRATQSLLRASQAMAALSARDYVSPDDIKEMVIPVLQHRIILRPEFEIEGLTVSDVIQSIIEDIAVPR